MRKILRNILFTILSLYLVSAAPAVAMERSNPKEALSDSTLRIDYSLSGNAQRQGIAFIEARKFAGWYGRITHQDSLALRGNGQLVMKDAESGKTLFEQSFSTLFQEWLTTEEATRLTKSMEYVALMPMPRKEVAVTIKLLDIKGNVTAELTHRINPGDILIRPVSAPVGEVRKLHRATAKGISQPIDIAFVAEGYKADEMDKFYAKAQRAAQEILSYEPFKGYSDRFNFVAIGSPSEDSGVSVPREGRWMNTAVGSHFDTFYSDRYLTTPNVRRLYDVIGNAPCEHVIILANTDVYGGGGIYNSYLLTTTGHASFLPVVVHEFGHSFAALADEYFYDDQYVNMYDPKIEPWEQNLTTLVDFGSKWKDMLPKGTPVPTPAPKGLNEIGIGVYEGGGYMSKGVFRPSPDCRMRTNSAREFCPVCRRAIERLIKFYTE